MSDPAAPRELSSWKEIASYLGASERAAQLWERQRGLPVHRLPGPGRGRVLAYPNEIDAWKRSAGSPPPADIPLAKPRKFPHIAYAALPLLLILIVGLLFFREPAVPHSIRLDGDLLIASDVHGRELWRRIFPNRAASNRYTETILADLNNDQSPETLVAHRRHGGNDELLCLNARGETLWRYRPGRAIRSQKRSYDNRFGILSFIAAPMGRDRRTRIAVSGHHATFSPAQVALLDENGRVLREYWHPGHINDIAVGDLDRDGQPELYFAGVNNVRGAATLIVLDPDTFQGSAADAEGLPHFPDLSISPELGRILMPRSHLNRSCFPYNGPSLLRIESSLIRYDTNENPPVLPGSPVIVYHLSPDLQIRDVAFSDSFLASHHKPCNGSPIAPDLRPSKEDLREVITLTPRHLRTSQLRR